MDIRFLFIGHEKVGKKSIISRFKILNCTKTSPLAKNEQLEKYKKKTVKKRDWEVLNEKDIELNRQYQREFDKNNELYNFKKLLKIPAFITLDNKFYDIENIYKPGFEDFTRDQEEVEKIHKLRFDLCKADVSNIINNIGNKPNTFLIFAFVFDLSNFESFEKLQIYYNELERVYNFKEKYKQILIGNKLDLAFKFEDSQKERIIDFIQENHLLYYETTTKMKFNFEILYESLFMNLLKNEHTMFSDPYFIDSFKSVLMSKENFSRAKRTSFEGNPNPGPDKYESNPFDISGKENLKHVYDNKYKFKNKIFLNKQGPSFGPKLDNKLKQKNAANARSLDTKKTRTVVSKPNEPLPPEYYQKLYNSNFGYTFSTKDNHLGFKERRHSQSMKMSRSFDEAFPNLDNISMRKSQKSPQNNKTEEYEKRREEFLSKKKEFKLKDKKFREKRTAEVKSRRVQLEEERMSTFQNRSMMHDSFLKEREEEKEEKSPEEEFRRSVIQERIENAEKARAQKRVNSIVPGPGTYNVRKEIELNRGKTFGLKLPTIVDRHMRSTGSYSIPSDIDEIARKKGQANFSKDERFAVFKEKYLYDRDEEERINQKKLAIKTKYPEMSDIMNKLVDQVNESVEKRQERLERIDNHVIQKQEVLLPGPGQYNITNFWSKDDEYDENTGEIKAKKGVLAIDLKDPFPKGPAFSMAGRNEKSSIGGKNNYDEQPGKFYGLEQSLSFLSKNVARSLNPLPNFNYVKNRDPLFSIPKCDRFPKKKDEDPAAQMLMDIMHQQQLLKNSNVELNNNPDRMFYQGKADRFLNLDKMPKPGPAQYKIEGFTDKLLRENNKRQNLRKKSQISTINHSKEPDELREEDGEENENGLISGNDEQN